MSFVIVVLIGIFCLFFLWPATSKADEKTEVPAVTAKSVKGMSRADVEKKLQNIEEKDAPLELRTALCYKVALPPDRAEYVCPVCGEKTLYPESKTDGTGRFINWYLEKARLEFANLKKATDLQIELDESSLCKKCHPETLNRTLVLKITYADGSTHKYPNVSPDDLSLLRFFFCDSLTYIDYNDEEQPIKPLLSRVYRLLGIKEKEVK